MGYFILTIGELFISPTFLTKSTELPPIKLVAFMVGASLLSSSFAHHLGGTIAKLTVPSDTSTVSDSWLSSLASSITGFTDESLHSSVEAVQSLALSTTVFAQIGIISIILSFVLLLFSHFIKKLMHGIH